MSEQEHQWDKSWLGLKGAESLVQRRSAKSKQALHLPLDPPAGHSLAQTPKRQAVFQLIQNLGATLLQ
jgi:hypothetical protein